MGIEFTNNFGDVAKQIERDIRKSMLDGAHEAAAEALADRARELGLSTTDEITLSVTEDSDLQIDAARAHARANEILAAD